MPNDVANVDLSKVRRGSGYESTDRKESATNNNARYSNRSNKSRMESGANSRIKKRDIQDNAINNQLQQTPRSPKKKGSKKPQYHIVAEKVSKGGRYSKEAVHDSINNNTS